MDELRKKFPSYFSKFELPEGAREQRLKVYRACKTQTVDEESFIPTFEENNYTYGQGDDPLDPGIYSLSTYEKPKDVKRFAITNNKFRKPYKIAIGYTEAKCGLSQITKERKPKSKSSHVDWWIYENAEPQKYFDMIKNFEEYYLNYKKERGV